MTSKFLAFIIFLFFTINNFSQTIDGIVLDAKTQLPIESASVYFDNTTIGTSTNYEGKFSLKYNKGIKSPLVISFLGYQKVIINNYTTTKAYRILLSEDLSTLDEVFISSDDGMPRAIKLQQFRKQFLGFSDNAKSCKILNEDDIRFRYIKKDNQLIASSNKPILIKNKNLQYLISFEIRDFVIDYKYVDLKLKQFGVKSVIYTGTSFYQNLKKSNKKKVIRQRELTYKGSVQHFMKALFNKKLEEEDYKIVSNRFIVRPYKYINVFYNENSELATIQLLKTVSILYNKKQSKMESKVAEFKVDKYGNYMPISEVLFGGNMGNQRIGDSLPFDYEMKN